MERPAVYEGKEPYIFISYAHRDSDRVIPLIEAIQNRGFRVWYDAGIEAGTEWPEYIAEHLDRSAAIIVFLSKSTLESHNCRREINLAIELRKDPLVVHMEDIQLTLGMRMQLGTLQAMFRNRHSSQEAFLDALCSAKMLLACKCEEPVQPSQPPLMEAKQEFPLETPGREPTPKEPEVEIKCNDPGKCFMSGWVLACKYEPDYVGAMRWYRRAAELGNARACTMIAELYFDGKGTEQSTQKAIEWYRMAMAMGEDVKKQLDVAMQRQAAEQGDVEAQYKYGMYCKNNARPIAAVHWLLKSANQGNSKAMYRLARCYEEGIGTAKNVVEAMQWYIKAAEKGNADAKAALASRRSN